MEEFTMEELDVILDCLTTVLNDGMCKLDEDLNRSIGEIVYKLENILY